MAFPTTEYKLIGIESNQAEGQYTSESGIMQSRRFGGQRFKMSIQLPPLTKAEMMPINAYLEGLQGESTSFTVSLPDIMLGTVAGTPIVNGTYQAGEYQVSIDGLTSGLTSAYAAGDFINFSGHTKAYMIVSNADSGADDIILDESSGNILDESSGTILAESSGQADVTIYPPLVENVADAESVSHGTSFSFTVKLSGGSHDYMVEPPNIYSKQIDVIEHLS